MVTTLAIISPLASLLYNRMWYSVPLVVVISLVYAATRHEAVVPIFRHALRFGLWVVGFMLIVFVILWMITWWL